MRHIHLPYAMHPRRDTQRKFCTLLVAILFTFLTVTAGLITSPPSASAAGSWGAGGFAWSSNGTWLGNFIAANGTRVYCIDLHISGVGSGGDTGEITSSISPLGGGSGGGTRALSGDDLRMINYAVTVHGQTSDDVTGAAVAAYVWNFTSTNHYGNGAHYIGGPYADEILVRYEQIKADTEANAHTSNGPGTGHFDFTIDPVNNYLGTMAVTASPASAAGTVALTNGVFADTGSAARNGVRHGETYEIRGVAPNHGSDYRISAEASYLAEGAPSYAADVRLHSDAPQRTVGPGTSTPGIFTFSAEGQDSRSRSSTFQPVVSTRVASEYVSEGQEFSDVLTFSTTADSSGLHNPWHQTAAGEYIPVTARGTLYGPLAQAPTESATPPTDTPVAASGIRVTTTPTEGPTIDYTVNSGHLSSAAGYYTWLWEIIASDQPVSNPGVQGFLPENYHFADRYGQTAETSFTGMRVSATSQVQETVVSPGNQVRDTLTVSSNGWLAGVTASFEGRVYAVTDGSIPVRSTVNPTTNVRLIDTVHIHATAGGNYLSPAVTVPNDAGHLIWVWSFDASQQANPAAFEPGYTWRDDWAVPQETQQVLFEPAVTTRAVSQVTQGEEFVDTLDAFAASGQWIEGTQVRATGTLYGPMLALPEESVDVPSWVMVAGTAEVMMTAAGEHTVHSGIISEEAGFYTWVWEIHAGNQSAETQSRIADGYSFVDNFAQTIETSLTPSVFAPVSKVTKPRVALSEHVQDTLSVQLAEGSGGWLQAGRQRVPVVFHGTAYFVAGADAPAISDSVPDHAEPLGTSTIVATGPGVYESELVRGETHRQGWISWVWEIRAEDQPTQHRDMIAEWADSFGLPNETHEILMPEVTTRAQAEASLGEPFTDTAVVSGTLPVPGMDLHFELYEATKNDAGDWVCEAGNLLWTSERTRVTSAGEYVSPPAPGQLAGTYHWVEVITATDGNEIARGVCALEQETTVVSGPAVTTIAQSAQLGKPIRDIAIVTGPVSTNGNTSIVFEAFHVPMVLDTNTQEWVIDAPADSIGLDWVCAAEPVFSTAEHPLTITTAGSHESASFTPKELGQYFWVETLTVRINGTPIDVHRGECGLRSETSFVTEVTTQAQPFATAGEIITDTAVLSGFFPEGSQLTFTAYQIAADAPQAGEPGVTDLCVAANMLASTEPVEVPHSQLLLNHEIKSAGVQTVGAAGEHKVYWVEEVVDELGNVLAQGECGLVNETSKIAAPPTPPLALTGASALGVGLASLSLILAGIITMIIQRSKKSKVQ